MPISEPMKSGVVNEAMKYGPNPTYTYNLSQR